MKGFWLCLAGCLLVLGIALESDYGSDSLSNEQVLYCEMTKAFKNSNGQYGWPDYRGNARKVCGE